MVEELARKFEAVKGSAVTKTDPAATGVHLDVLVEASSLRDAAALLRAEEFLIESASALDAKPSMMGLYHFTRVDRFVRVCLRVMIERENPSCPTIQDIFPGANWHERETHDFFGIVYDGHPDMTPLILPEDAGDLKPLLKSEKALKDLGEILPRFAPPKPAAEEKPEVAQ